MKNSESEFYSGERLYDPYSKLREDDSGAVRSHLDRYNFALGFLRGGEVVLDAACGSGYGSEILASRAKKVVGVEINDHALGYALAHHNRDNIEFRKLDLNQKLDFASEFFDFVVSFETLEHVQNQEGMLSEFKRILKKGGKLIISTPDKDLISGGLDSDNPFHVKELTKGEFVDILTRYFKVENLYGQTEAVELPTWKKTLKKLRKITFLRRLKQNIARMLGIEKILHSHLSAEAYTEIKEINIKEETNRFYVLIAVCRKKG